MKKIVAIFCTLLLSTSMVYASFFDVPSSNQYVDAIHYVQSSGYVAGYADGTYKPNNQINRAEFTKIIVNAYFAELAAQESCDNNVFQKVFSDIPQSAWFKPYICSAYNHKVVGGYSDGTFRPDGKINFVEAAKVIVKAYDPDGTKGYSNKSGLTWYEPFVSALRDRDAVPPTIQSNDQLISRGEMAYMIWKFQGFGLKTNANVNIPLVSPTPVAPVQTVVAVKMDDQLPVAPRPVISPDARIIGYKITSMMYDSVQQKAIPTPQPIIDKIHKAFELWESDSNIKIGFRYDGLAADHYDSRDEIPSDGRIYVVLNAVNQSVDPGAAGVGGYVGTIPGGYQKGYAFIETRKGLYTATLKDIVHEIGHAIGLDHTPTNSSIMSCGTATWGDREVLALTELDRVYLTKLWAPDASTRLYSISGKVTTNTSNATSFVFAVNTVNGHTYSNLSNSLGDYTIPIFSPGQYRVFAKGYEASAFDAPVSVSPSWYVSAGVSTNDPYGGATFPVDSAHRNTTNINVTMIQQPVPFNLFWTVDTNGPTGPYIFNHAFLKKGSSGEILLEFLKGKPVSSVQAYGSSPDYSLTNLHTTTLVPGGESIPAFTVSATSNAEAGDRLVIARGPSGNIQAGLIGINIIGTKDPSFISNDLPYGDPNFSLGESGWVKRQIEKNFNFSWLDATYWMQ